MEGIVTYESSYEYIKKLQKDTLTNQPITIDFNKLDSDSAGLLMRKITEALSQRYTAIYNIMASNQDQLLH